MAPAAEDLEAASDGRRRMPACSVCATELDPRQVLYGAQGQVICQPCVTASQVRAGHAKSAATARSAAYGNVAVGLVSFVFNPFLVISIAAVGNALFVFRRIADDQGRGEAIPDALARKVAVTIGAVLGLAALAERLLL
jgi:hypothetical protein